MNVKYIIPLLGKSAYLNIDVICSVDGYIVGVLTSISMLI